MAKIRADGDSKLLQWMETMNIRPARLYAEIRRVSGLLGVRPMSKRHFTRIYQGESSATTKIILLVVAAARGVSGLPIRAAELFDVEPAAGTLSSDLLVGHPDPLRGRTTQLSVFWRPRHFRSGSLAHVSQEHSLLTAAETLEVLYHEYGPLMMTYARVQFSLDETEAEAIVHDVFLSFLERQPKVDNIRSFLLGATRNACNHYWRKRDRETVLPDDLADAGEDQRQARWPLLTTLVVALAHIGPRCRDTLHRFYNGGEGVEEIAERLNVTPEYVYQILVSCRKRLREIVSDPARRMA